MNILLPEKVWFDQSKKRKDRKGKKRRAFMTNHRVTPSHYERRPPSDLAPAHRVTAGRLHVRLIHHRRRAFIRHGCRRRGTNNAAASQRRAAPSWTHHLWWRSCYAAADLLTTGPPSTTKGSPEDLRSVFTAFSPHEQWWSSACRDDALHWYHDEPLLHHDDQRNTTNIIISLVFLCQVIWKS